MIIVYNETNHAWSAEKQKDEDIIRIGKTRVLKPREQGGEAKTRQLSILGYERYMNTDLNDQLQGAVRTKNPIVVGEDEGEGLSTIFNRKAFRPFITNTGEKRFPKDILLASLSLRGRSIIDSEFKAGAFLLEYMVFGGELSFVASLRPGKGQIKITLLNKETTKQEVHVFEHVDDVYTHSVTIQEHDGITDRPGSKLRKYRPSFPSHAILVHADDVETLTDVLVYPERQNIIPFTRGTMQSQVKLLKADNYRAVTVFANIASSGKPDQEKNKEYKLYVDSMLSEFHTVVKLYNDGKTRIIQC